MSSTLIDLPRGRHPVGEALRRQPAAIDAVRLAGFPVRDTRGDALTRFLRRRLRSGRKIAVGFVNQNFVISCQHLRATPGAPANLLLVNDGIGMQIAALLRFGRRFRENLNGTDFVPRFLKQAGRPLTVFLVGSDPAVVVAAARVIDGWPGCRVVGRCDGFSLWQREQAVIDEIAAVRPDILLVGLGNPIQEQWVLRHWEALDAGIVFGVGALFEWLSGYRRRAPMAIRRLRLEWVYRLVLEPRRLYRRYTIGILRFFALVFRHGGQPRPGIAP